MMNQEPVMIFNGDEAVRLTSDPVHDVTPDGVIAAFYNEMQQSMQVAVENTDMDVDQNVIAHNFASLKEVCQTLNIDNVTTSVDGIATPADVVNSVLSDDNLKFMEETPCDVLVDDSNFKVKGVEIPDSWRIAVLESNGIVSHNAEPLVENEKEIYQLWECSKCTALFREKEICEQHVTRAHDFSCGLCGEPFVEKEDLENHIIRHISEIPSQARPQTDNATVSVESPSRATQNFDSPSAKDAQDNVPSTSASIRPNETFICDICNLSFSSMGDLVKHKESHVDVDDDEDEDDSSSQVKEAELVQVVTDDSNSRDTSQYSCRECEKRCFTKNALLLHIRKRHARAGNKKFTCEDCGKCFEWKLSLENHRVVQHHEQRVFRCVLCSKNFHGRGEWEEHIRLHKAEKKPLACDFCGAKFSHSARLMRHIKALHPGSQEFSCPACDKSFKSTLYVKAHMSEVHPSLYND